jgi:hypothetical protein
MVLGDFSQIPEQLLDPTMALRWSDALQDPFVISTQILLIPVTIVGLFIYVKWYSYAHEMGKTKVLVALFAGVLLAFAVLEFAFYPIWRYLEGFLVEVLKFI